MSDEVWPPELNEDLIYHPMSREERMISELEDEEFLELAPYQSATVYSRDAVSNVRIHLRTPLDTHHLSV